jgi:hypothetical protein
MIVSSSQVARFFYEGTSASGCHVAHLELDVRHLREFVPLRHRGPCYNDASVCPELNDDAFEL